MPTLPISADEAELLVTLLRPRASLLAEMLELQVRYCPPGCTAWADTADALAVANDALIKLRNAQLEHSRGQGNG